MPFIRPTRSSFASDCRGVTAVEFAFIAPALLTLMSGTVEVSLAMFAQHLMESATFAAAREGKTGYSDSGISREETIINTLNARAGQVLNTDNITITSVSYSQFDQIGQPEPFIDANHNGVRDTGENYTDVNGNSQYDTDMGAEGVGSAGQVVVYTVSYPWQIATPIIGHFIGHEGTLTLSARMIVKNEPY